MLKVIEKHLHLCIYILIDAFGAKNNGEEGKKGGSYSFVHCMLFGSLDDYLIRHCI